MKYKKYFRKTSLKQKGVGEFFLKEVAKKNPKVFLEVGVFHGVTARNVCELLYKMHGQDFKYVGLDLFAKNLENKDEVIPDSKFSNPLKNFAKSKKQETEERLKLRNWWVSRSRLLGICKEASFAICKNALKGLS